MSFSRTVEQVVERVLAGGAVGYAEALQLQETHATADIILLVAGATRVRGQFHGIRSALCALVNAKSGGCPEDCSYCVQSSGHATGVEVYALLPEDVLVARATSLQATGADHVCLVMSGRGPGDDDLAVICRAAERIRRATPLTVCACLGLLSDVQARCLREAGVQRYNHNLETAESFFPSICRTHTWEERHETAWAVKRAGLELCCGGILGLGEAPHERLDLAFTLRELEPEVVPLNVLDPRPGTPLMAAAPLAPLEIVKTIALFRLILPRSTLKLAGGREGALRSLQGMGMLAGANGLIVGGYLTTTGRPVAHDLQMLADCEFETAGRTGTPPERLAGGEAWSRAAADGSVGDQCGVCRRCGVPRLIPFPINGSKVWCCPACFASELAGKRVKAT